MTTLTSTTVCTRPLRFKTGTFSAVVIRRVSTRYSYLLFNFFHRCILYQVVHFLFPILGQAKILHSHTVLLSFYHTVLLSFHPTVPPSYCLTILLSYSLTPPPSYCLTVLLSLRPTVLLSFRHTILLSHCHTVLLSLCHTVILSLCHTVLLPHCHTVLLSLCHHGIVFCCHILLDRSYYNIEYDIIIYMYELIINT